MAVRQQAITWTYVEVLYAITTPQRVYDMPLVHPSCVYCTFCVMCSLDGALTWEFTDLTGGKSGETGAQFTYDLSIVIKICQKILLPHTQILMNWSVQNFVHDMIVVLL